jgi:hypothetical protein
VPDREHRQQLGVRRSKLYGAHERGVAWLAAHRVTTNSERPRSERAMQVIGALTQRPLLERSHPSSAIVVHTTGDSDLDRILRFYRSLNGLQPQYMIAVDGVIRRTAWENQVAYHCKIDPAEARLYQRGYGEWSRWRWGTDRPVHVGDEFSGYRGWRDEWRAAGLESPLELVTGEHPNSVSIGVEPQ